MAALVAKKTDRGCLHERQEGEEFGSRLRQRAFHPFDTDDCPLAQETRGSPQDRQVEGGPAGPPAMLAAGRGDLPAKSKSSWVTYLGRQRVKKDLVERGAGLRGLQPLLSTEG